MVKRNKHFTQFHTDYLFVDIAQRKQIFLEKYPTIELISLGIGDTTEPIPSPIIEGFRRKATDLSTVEKYTGYPEYNGSLELRKLIASTFYKGCDIAPDEIFISDGSKPDLARLQLLFSPSTTVAVQDPVYPAYVDGSVLSGKGGLYDEEKQQYSNIVYMACTPQNNFFPDLQSQKRTDLIFFCSPNNPTGAAASRKNLTELVKFAKKNNSIIIYDAAYSVFIKDPDCPKTIFEIPEAKTVAFETSSFSKFAGFTGVRLGWTVCPKSLKYCDQTSILPDWSRIMGTCFNGPSNLAEAGAIAALKPSGYKKVQELTEFYLENARIIKSTMERIGFSCYGGQSCPYIWIYVPNKSSWETFQFLLEKANVVVTPGCGFGRQGNSFIRISGFAHRSDVNLAIERIEKAFKSQLE